ncbi:MAG: UDP-N-acetylmuramoyl-L-alanine--D-glutamate ligase [Deltaproteobacteria bacterium]
MLNPRALFEGKKVTLMGLGLLGRGLGDTLFLIRCGARVTVTDLKNADELGPSVDRLRGLPCTLKLGGHDPTDFINADMILRNADVPRSSPFLKIAADHGIAVEMDESLFCKIFPGKVVGITGTRGKTTSTVLVHRILSLARSGVFLAGNIMGLAALPLLEKIREDDTVVLELSSWQLQGFHDSRLSPNISLFTNLYPDHLNRYASMQDYLEDKKAIYRYQHGGDFCIFNGDQIETARLAEEAPAGKGFFQTADIPAEWKIKLPGAHNRENVAAAIRLTREMGIEENVIRSAVESFTGVEHRLQWLGERGGIAFVNDATSTTPDAGRAALKSFEGRRVLLIAGGSDKNLDLRPFARSAAARCGKIALLEGNATDTLHQEIAAHGGAGKIAGRFDDLKRAVDKLMAEAAPGDVILLSPGCASFGMFRNEYHRGETFISIVEEILAAPPTASP